VVSGRGDAAERAVSRTRGDAVERAVSGTRGEAAERSVVGAPGDATEREAWSDDSRGPWPALPAVAASETTPEAATATAQGETSGASGAPAEGVPPARALDGSRIADRAPRRERSRSDDSASTAPAQVGHERPVPAERMSSTRANEAEASEDVRPAFVPAHGDDDGAPTGGGSWRPRSPDRSRATRRRVAPGDAAPSIEVTVEIGALEIVDASSLQAAPPRPVAPMSLSDYLRRRGGGP
jgi:hypothetical protein